MDDVYITNIKHRPADYRVFISIYETKNIITNTAKLIK